MSSRTNTATLADIKAEIESQGERFSARPADTLQALDRLAKITRRSLASIPASRVAVNQLLKAILWQNVGFTSKKAHDNWRALVRGAVRRSRKAPRSHILLSPRRYPAEWQSWIAAVDKSVKGGLISPFVRADVSAVPAWCSANGILPVDFDDATAQMMADWYVKNRPSNGRRPNRYVKSAINAWNALARAGVGGGTCVARPLGRGRERNIQIDQMPASLVADLEAYIDYTRTRSTIGTETVVPPPAARKNGSGRFDHLLGQAIIDVATAARDSEKRAGRPLGPVSEETVKNTRHDFRLLVTAATEARLVPLVEGVRLKAYLNRPAMVAGFYLIEKRLIEAGKMDENTESKDMPASVHAFGSKVCAIAAWAGIDELELKAMRLAVKSDAVKSDSVDQMPEPRRQMLEEMDDSLKVLEWFNAPGVLWCRAEAARKEGRIDWELVRDAETAFIAWLLSRLPIRRKNIAQLTIRMLGNEEAMVRLGRFDDEPTVIVIPGRFVKNGKPIRFKVTGEGLKMLRGLLAKGGYRDMAMKLGGFRDSEFLFIGDSASWAKRKWRVEGHRSMAALSDGYKVRMREFGIPATLHMARHIAAQIALDFDPGALAIVAQLLGSSVKTVQKHYLSDRTSKAAAAFDEIVKGSIGKALKMLSEGKQG